MRTLMVAAPLVAGEVEVVGGEAHHGRSVLRLSTGDVLRLVDGAGRWARAEVVAVERHRILTRVDGVQSGAELAMQAVTLAVAPPKGGRFDDVVRAATELGVGAIRPLVCERVTREPNLERSRRVAVEALKQCGRVHLPQIGPALDFPTLAELPGRRIVGDPRGGPLVPGILVVTTVIVGPEGGFTANEDAALAGWGVEAVRLAGPVLRIETAALAACAVLASVWEQYGE